MSHRKFRTGYITTTVDVDISDVIDEMDDDDIRKAYEDRGLGSKIPAPATEMELLVEAVEDRHQRDHHGPLTCCADPICDALDRVYTAKQRSAKPNLSAGLVAA